jgi:hypothetical protein
MMMITKSQMERFDKAAEQAEWQMKRMEQRIKEIMRLVEWRLTRKYDSEDS